MEGAAQRLLQKGVFIGTAIKGKTRLERQALDQRMDRQVVPFEEPIRHATANNKAKQDAGDRQLLYHVHFLVIYVRRQRHHIFPSRNG
ncbi:hypothetical protein D3C71_1564770 [compost metagenome]